MRLPSLATCLARNTLCGLGFALFGSALFGCSEAAEAPRVELPVFVDGSGLETVTTDLGYEVELSSASLALDNLTFAIAGEAHSSLWRSIASAIVSTAYAHPGHFQDGEITGEMPGHFIVHFLPGKQQELGTATLFVGQYRSANFTFAHASEDDVDEDDPVLGQTAVLRGSATKDGSSIDFEALLSSPEGRELIGIPFEEEISESTKTKLVLRLLTLDPREKDSLFDGIDFAALDSDADGQVSIHPSDPAEETTAAYNALRRTFQTHDHFVVQTRK